MSVNVQKSKSVGLVSLFLISLFVTMVSTTPTVMAVNETSSGTLTGTETWTGVMNMDGDLLVAGGAKLIINAGTLVNIPANKVLLSKVPSAQVTHHVVHLKQAQVLRLDLFGLHQVLQVQTKPVVVM